MNKILNYIKCYLGLHSSIDLGRNCYWIDTLQLSEHPKIADICTSDSTKAIMCKYCRKML